jgi:hypothetical protein
MPLCHDSTGCGTSATMLVTNNSRRKTGSSLENKGKSDGPKHIKQDSNVSETKDR